MLCGSRDGCFELGMGDGVRWGGGSSGMDGPVDAALRCCVYPTYANMIESTLSEGHVERPPGTVFNTGFLMYSCIVIIPSILLA